MPRHPDLLLATASALVLVGTVGATVLAGPAPAAQAQAGYRVCAAFTQSSQDGRFGNGLVVKLPKGDWSECRGYVTAFRAQFGAANLGTPGGEARSVYGTALNMPCEDFTMRASGQSGDICGSLLTGKWNTFITPYDTVAPASRLTIRRF